MNSSPCLLFFLPKHHDSGVVNFSKCCFAVLMLHCISRGVEPPNITVHCNADRRASPSRKTHLAFSYRGKTVALAASGAQSGWPASNGGWGCQAVCSLWLRWTCSGGGAH